MKRVFCLIAIAALLVPWLESGASAAAARPAKQAHARRGVEVRSPVGAKAQDPTAYYTPNDAYMRTPASIQVVPQQVIQDQQDITLGEALRNVSGVTVTGRGWR